MAGMNGLCHQKNSSPWTTSHDPDSAAAGEAQAHAAANAVVVRQGGLLGRKLDGTQWFSREEGQLMRAHPEWRKELL